MMKICIVPCQFIAYVLQEQLIILNKYELIK